MKSRAWLLVVAMALVSHGCIFVADDEVSVSPAVGTLTVEWRIEGYADPLDCDDNRIDLLELVIYDRYDRYLTEVEAPCGGFNVSIDLLDGLYSADATLIDYLDRSATLTLAVDNIDILAGTELVVPIDFAYSSFL